MRRRPSRTGSTPPWKRGLPCGKRQSAVSADRARELVEHQRLHIVGAIYGLETGRVIFTEPVSLADHSVAADALEIAAFLEQE